MSNPMQDGMAEAMRLTRQGRLAEATAVIQRTLGGAYAPASSPDGPGREEEQIETTRRAANEAPSPAAPSQQDSTEKRALRRAPRPSRGFRGMSWTPGNLLGTGPGPTADVPNLAIVPAGGQFVERSYTNRAGTRAYKLYIPSGYVGQEVPLVVMLHGCTQSPDDFAAGTHMNALAETHTFLVAYPAQAAAANSSKCWNWFKAADQQRGRGEPSIIAGITCEILGEYHIAADRVYVAGMSAGGAMAAILGTAYPDLYAAIGVHSGLAPGAAHDLSSAFSAMRDGATSTVGRNTPTGEPPRIVPAILFHGDRDRTVNPRNTDQLLAHYRLAGNQQVAGEPAPMVTVRQGQVPGGHSYTRATHHVASGRVIMEQWTIHGLGHAWSGGSHPGSYTDSKGPDASAEMLRFFNQHPWRKPMEQPTD